MKENSACTNHDDKHLHQRDAISEMQSSFEQAIILPNENKWRKKRKYVMPTENNAVDENYSETEQVAARELEHRPQKKSKREHRNAVFRTILYDTMGGIESWLDSQNKDFDLPDNYHKNAERNDRHVQHRRSAKEGEMLHQQIMKVLYSRADNVVRNTVVV
jgi:hypothetical protein